MSFTETMLIPSDVRQFLDSDIAEHCKTLAMNPKWEVVKSDFYDVRDFLILRILQTNAQRPQAVRSITERVLNRATTNEDGWATLAVSMLKTKKIT